MGRQLKLALAFGMLALALAGTGGYLLGRLSYSPLPLPAPTPSAPVQSVPARVSQPLEGVEATGPTGTDSTPALAAAAPPSGLLAAPATIAGVVLGLDGVPIPDAFVNLYSDQGEGAQTRTDQAGQFRAKGLDPVPYTVEVSHSEYQTTEVAGILPGAPALRLRLQPFGRVIGRVIEKATRRPITEFNLLRLQEPVPRRLSSLEGDCQRGSSHVYVSPTGEFEITQVPAGAHSSIGIFAKGYLPARLETQIAAPGETRDLGEIPLSPGGSLFVSVVDPAGRKLPDAEVRVSQENFDGYHSEVEEGTHHFFALRPGEYTVEASAPGFGNAAAPASIGEGPPTTLELQLSPAPRVVGTVYFGGVPVQDARVEAFNVFGKPMYTNKDGRYELPMSHCTQCEITAWLPPDLPASALRSMTARVQVEPGTETQVDFNFPLQPAEIVGTFSLNGRPVAGSLRLRGENGIVIDGMPTESDGTYRIVVPPGTVTVEATVDHDGAARARTGSVFAVEGQTVELHFDFGGSASVSGRVVMPAPAYRAQVALVQDGAPVDFTTLEGLGQAEPYIVARSLTGDDGAYRIDEVPPGSYTVLVAGWDGTDIQRTLRINTSRVTLQEDRVATLNLSL